MSEIGPAVANGGLLRFVTAGSVDDGKSTLIGRLLHDTQTLFVDQLAALKEASMKRGAGRVDLALLTDALEAEREQSITIDVAYRHFATPARKFVLGDAPGHVQYTRNMITAASTADVVVLLVDARKGILTQTRRHTYLAHWLGITRIVLAINKMDLIGYTQDCFDKHRTEFLQFAAPLGFEEVVVIPISALEGDTVVTRGRNLPWYTGATLLDFLEQTPVLAKRLDADFRFPVQRTVRLSAEHQTASALPTGLGCQGTVAAGRVQVGDTVIALPSAARATVLAIRSPAGASETAHCDEAVTIFLPAELDLKRGDLIVAPARPAKVVERLDAELCWVSEAPYAPGRIHLLKHTTRTVGVASIKLRQLVNIETLATISDPQALRMSDIARVEVRLHQPICADPYRLNRTTGSFILIDATTNDTVAAGIIREHPEA